MLLLFSHCTFAQNYELFESEEILEISLKGDFEKLLKDTKGEPQYFDFPMWITLKIIVKYL